MEKVTIKVNKIDPILKIPRPTWLPENWYKENKNPFDYFSELDRRLRVEFPNKFDKVDEPTTEKARPAQTVASAKRPAATGRNKTVSLTPTEVAIARRIGVSLEDYAREKYAKEGRSI